MKLSEISTDKAISVLCELTPYINNIASDEELLAEIKRKVDAGTVTNRVEWLAIGVEKVNKIVPILLKKRKADVLGILGVLNEKSPEEVEKQNFLVTAKQVAEIVRDKELIDFFKSCTDTAGSE